MENLNNINDLHDFKGLPTRHMLLFSDIASGLSLSEAAKQRNYSIPHACRLVRSEKGRLALAHMRAEIELVLTENLAGLIAQSLDILKGQLESPLVDRRVIAATQILRMVKPLIDSIILKDGDSASGSVIDLQHTAPDGGGN